MKKTRVLALLLVTIIFFAFMATSCANKETIKIGIIIPLSGPVSAYGIQSRNASQMAVDEINANDGVLGRQLELIIEDDEANPEKTKSAFTKLATKDKVVALVGAYTSNCSLAITKNAQEKMIPMVTPTSTNDMVTDEGDYIFRACYNDSFQGQVVAQFSAETLGAKNAAILFNITNEYSKGLTENFKEKFESLGGTIVSEKTYSTGDKDFNAQLTTIKGTTPDILFIPDYYNTVSQIVKQVRSIGIQVPMLGADGWNEITNNAGEEADGSYYSNHYSPDEGDPKIEAFVAAYQSKYDGDIPNALAALSYDATMIVIDAIKKAESTEPENIKQALKKTDKKYVTGYIKFDENRNPVKSAVIVKVVAKDGALTTEYTRTVNP